MTEQQPVVGHQSHPGPRLTPLCDSASELPSDPASDSQSESLTATTAAAQAMSRVAEVARVSLQTQGFLARQSVDLTWATVVKDLDRVSANRAYVGSVARESARYWRTVGELGVDCASDLITMGRSVAGIVLRAVAAAGRMPRSRRRAAQAEPPAAL